MYAVLLCILLGAGACDRSGTADGKGEPNGEALAATPALIRQTVPYRERTLGEVGTVLGSVIIEGTPPPDTVIQPSVDSIVCAPVTRRGVPRVGDRALGVVVWIDDLRSGKALPVERRFEIAHDRCLLVPEVQTAIAGGTLNVRSFDPVEHRTRITRRDGGDVLATIRETDAGQVVPDDRVLARPGVLELSCLAHPWARAWIAVFDHPYFAMTSTDGTFAIDSVPPGRYEIRAWHPRLGLVVDSVTVVADSTVTITLR